MQNPLLMNFNLPPFSAIRSDHIFPAVQSSIHDYRQAVQKVVEHPGPYTWDNLCQLLAEYDDKLNCIWSTVSHLNAVQNSTELREAYEKSLLLISEFTTWLSQNNALYFAYCSLRESNVYNNQLSIAQKKAVDNTIRDFELSGISLSWKNKNRYGQIVSRLAELSAIYNNNILDSTMQWRKLVQDESMLIGIPNDAIELARTKAETYKQKGWLLTLDSPCYQAVLTYCDNSILREEFYRAYHTRASDLGTNAERWDNGPIMNEILTLRYELAKLLGYENYVDLSLATKMARDTKIVLDFLLDLVKRAKPQAEKEIMQLRKFSKDYFDHDRLEPWDIAYFSEKQKQHLLSINEETLREYFPIQQVLRGLFVIIKKIYGVTEKIRTSIDSWHPDVLFFDLLDLKTGELRGSLYLDLYARENKRSGAWMDNCVNLIRTSDGKIRKPVAYITCNFNRPIDGKPALLTHQEVITLFHEVGHGLHHILTSIETAGVSGINGVAWDGIELPSQFMENYCWQPESLSLVSSHYHTGQTLPDTILRKLIQLRHYQSALFIIRQLELCLFDFYLHYNFRTVPGQREYIINTLLQVKKQIAIFPILEGDRCPHSFNHIFSGGYAAGYYSYLWAEVLASDVWSRFEDEGVLNAETGLSFLENLLSRGGSEDLMDLFIRFRGRKPTLDAMLKKYGIVTST